MTTLIGLLLVPIVLPFMLIGWLFKFLSRNRTLAVGLALLIVGSTMFNEETPEIDEPSVSQSTNSFLEANTDTAFLAEQTDTDTWTDYSTVTLCDQTVDPVQASLPWSHRNGGVCRTLKENASVAVVFLEDNQSDWTEWEMRNYLDTMVSPALDYIEYNASRYGYNISLDYFYYVDDYGNPDSTEYYGSVRDFNNDGGTTDVLSQSANVLGYGSAEEMLWSDRNYSGNDQIAYLFVLDKPGRSYAYWNHYMGEYVEYAVVFTSQNGYQERPSVIAHEVLHLFGAEDMYAEGAERVNRARMAKQVCPNEIFLNPQWNLYDNDISDFTAYTVGWLDYFPDLYWSSDWWS